MHGALAHKADRHKTKVTMHRHTHIEALDMEAGKIISTLRISVNIIMLRTQTRPTQPDAPLWIFTRPPPPHNVHTQLYTPSVSIHTKIYTRPTYRVASNIHTATVPHVFVLEIYRNV